MSLARSDECGRLRLANTGMRPSEARNLRWRDVVVQTDRQNRQFVRLSVRGKGKQRTLVAAGNVATYLDRIKEVSNHKTPDDFVFGTQDGQMARTLYYSLVERLLIESKLQISSSGSRRSTYATRYLQFTDYVHIHRPPMRLSGPMRGSVRRVPNTRGDLPDWVAWGPTPGLGIVEAKGCHDAGGPQAARDRAFRQAERAEIRTRNGRAPFKRYAIATRWGFASPTASTPMLAVKDPEIEGEDATPDEIDALKLGIARLHSASLLERLGYKELADALKRLAMEPFHNRVARALADARAAFDRVHARRVDTPERGVPLDDLVGGFITRNGPTGDLNLSEADQQTLRRLQMRPTFVGIERRGLKFIIEGTPAELAHERSTSIAVSKERGPTAPSNDGSGIWIVRLDDDRTRIS